MTNTGPTGKDHLRGALGLCIVGLSSLLFWGAAITIFGQDDHCVLIVLAPLTLASFSHPLLARFLGWGGVLAQIAVVLLAL